MDWREFFDALLPNLSFDRAVKRCTALHLVEPKARQL
jgi:hypothetical protein